MDISFASRDCEESAESGAMSLITLLIQNLEQSTLHTILSILLLLLVSGDDYRQDYCTCAERIEILLLKALT
jgi:hypothetical protein